MAQTTFDITGTIVLDYDEQSDRFQETLRDYRASMDKTAYPRDMLRHVAYSLVRFGVERMVEGVGYVWQEGRTMQEPYSGIMVLDGFDELEFD